MGGKLAKRAETTRRRAGSPWAAVRIGLVGLVALALLAPVAAAAQQDTTRAGRRDTAAADTLPADSAAGDTLTARERALLRLRALPRSPVQPDPADSLRADSLRADSLRADSLRADSLGADGPPADSVPGAAGDSARAGDADGVVADTTPGDSARLGPEPPDTLGVRLPAEGVVLPGPGWVPRPGAGARRTADPGPMVEADVRAELEALEGYVRTEYRGQGAVFRAESNQLEITGESRIAREGNALETDSLLVYDSQTDVVCGYGRPVLSGENEPVESDRVCFDVARDVGMAEGARTRFTQQGTWYVRGANNRVFVLPGEGGNTLYGERTQFTSCDLEHPHYTFEARSLKMIDGGMMVARDVTLQFEDVPVFWLPWMVTPNRRGRQSGLLMPQFGVNDIVRNSTGYNRSLSNLGFYWAINDYASARGTFEWYSGNWTAVQGALTYHWRRQFLQGSLTAKHYWREQAFGPAGREFTLNTGNSWQPDERTRIQLNGNYASSTDFVRTNTFDPRELNQSLRSSASINRSFDWGSMTLGADRRQQIGTGQVDMTLPSLRLSLSPLTLYSGEEGFNVTWTGSGNATRSTRDALEDTVPGVRDSERRDVSVSHSLTMGRFSIGQTASYRENIQGPKPPLATPVLVIDDGGLRLQGADIPGLPEETSETLDWSTSLGFQQNLWVGTTLNPSVSVNGSQVRSPDTRLWNDSLDTGSPEAFVAEPLRLSAGASLRTAIYGFWPGVGRYSRIRHKITPNVRWSYSPKPTVTALQDSVFGSRNLRERNQVTLSFSQTFEAKVEGDDTASADTADTADSAELGQPGEPRRLPQAEKITLLALNTSTPFTYDFVAAAEDGRGFQTDQLSNSIRSDLVQGLQVSTVHDLFEEEPAPAGGGLAPRTLAPFLTRLSASFSIDNDFWLFRVLGLSGGEDRGPDAPEVEDPEAEAEEEGLMAVGAEAAAGRDIGGPTSVVPGGPRGGPGGAVGGVGQWRASLSYSLQRTRAVPGRPGEDSQLLQANVSFDPTEHWSVRWSTAYSFTDSEFTNHYLTLSRDLHRWVANFDFMKAQNGNFAMQFRVELMDQRDLKLDYDQRTRSEPAPGIQPRDAPR